MKELFKNPLHKKLNDVICEVQDKVQSLEDVIPMDDFIELNKLLDNLGEVASKVYEEEG